MRCGALWSPVAIRSWPGFQSRSKFSIRLVACVPGLFNAAASAVLSPLRHTCDAKQGG